MYCPNCGTNIPDGSLFCPSCGTRISAPDGSSFSDGSTPDRRSSGADAESGEHTDFGGYTGSGEETQFADLRNIRREYPTPHPSRKDDRSGERFNIVSREDYEEDDDDDEDGNSRLPVILAGAAIAFAVAVLLFVLFKSGFHLSGDGGASSGSGAESISSSEEVSSSVDSSSERAESAAGSGDSAAVVTESPVISSTPVPDSTDSADTAASITTIPTVTPSAAQAGTAAAVPQAASDDYVIPDSSTRELIEADLAGLTAEEVRIAKNELYARHGRRFNSADLQAYFDSKSWYSGTIAPDVFDANANVYMSSLELKNAEFIEEYQKSKGWI